MTPNTPSDRQNSLPTSSTAAASSRSPSSMTLASRRIQCQVNRPALARRAHFGPGSNRKPWLRIFNRPTVILEAILLNLPISDLIVAMHVSKTWLHVACQSTKIRRRLFHWHVEHVVDSRPCTPNISTTKPVELFPKNLREGLLITCRTSYQGEYFVLLKNHCERRALQLLDNSKTKSTLDPLTGKFCVKLFDHSNKLVLETTLSPSSIPFRCKQPIITGDRLFNYFKMFHSPACMNWDILLESMATRTPLEKAESGEVSLKERTAFTQGLMKALRKLGV